MFKDHFVSVLLGVMLVGGLSGCGAGEESDDEQAGGIQNITVTPLSRLGQEYDEHEIVVLSLNTQGDRVDNVTYDWTLEFNGQPLAFTGQNSEEISFQAPEVDGFGIVSVSVSLDLDNGNLLGNDYFTSSLTINDLDPLRASSQGIIDNGLSTTLPEVSSLNMLNILEDTTWRLNTYQSSPTLAGYGFEGDLYVATQQISYFDADGLGGVGFRRCGSSSVEAFVPSFPQSSCSGTFERKQYQSTDYFRVEERCDGDVIFATNFTKLRDNQTESFGEASLTFSSYDDFSVASNVCGAVSETLFVVHEDSNNDGHPDNSVIGFTYAELHAEYEGSPITVKVDIDDVRSFWIYNLDDFFDPDGVNDIQFDSPALPKLDGFSADDGRLDVERSLSGIEVEVDAEITDLDDETELVEGSFSLSFE